MAVLVLFRRDLRVTDHRALTRAAEIGADYGVSPQGVLPLYVVDPVEWSAGTASGRQWEFVAEALAGLRQDLAAAGAPLIVRVGAEVSVIARLVRGQQISTILAHSTPWTAARDAAIADWARAEGVRFETLPEDKESLPAPRLTPLEGVEPGMIPHARALGLGADLAPHRQQGGRAAALALLESFVVGKRAGQGQSSASPIGGERSGLRLSAHLALGTLSVPEVQGALSLSPQARLVGAKLAARARMLRQAGQECHLPPAAGTHVAALLAGQTGLPFVDACLRYYKATGWLNAAGRGMLASIGVHHLGLDPAAVGQVLARLSIDYHPALLWPNLASVAGGRPCDPLRLGEEHDAEGVFIRRWLPELAKVPDMHLHRPWRWTGAGQLLGRRYPEPLIDPFAALRFAREAARRHIVAEAEFQVIEGGTRLPPLPRKGQPVQLALDL